MNNQLHRIAIALAWLALALTWLQYRAVWDRLPAHVATHFDAAGHANRWMTRENALNFPLILAAVLLTVFTVILFRLRAQGREFWALLGLLYLVMGVLAVVNNSIIEYNLEGSPIQIAPVLIAVFIGVIVVLVVFLSAHRGQALPAESVIAEEVHTGHTWTALFLIPLFIEATIFVTVPSASLRLAMGVAALLFLLFAAASWDGFHYTFTRAGVEIRTLGFRLRSIPAAHIRSYAVQSWNPIGGYGIRGVGNRRAYVWGNKGVLIKTADGEIFLGHADPDRIVRDLDAIRQLVPAP